MPYTIVLQHSHNLPLNTHTPHSLLLAHGASTTLPDSTGRQLKCVTFSKTQYVIETHHKERMKKILDALKHRTPLKEFEKIWQVGGGSAAVSSACWYFLLPSSSSLIHSHLTSSPPSLWSSSSFSPSTPPSSPPSSPLSSPSSSPPHLLLSHLPPGSQ